jgi:hypothetical protein
VQSGFTGCGKTRRSNKRGARRCITRIGAPQGIDGSFAADQFFSSLFKPDQKQNFGGARKGWKMMGGKLVDLLARIP